MKKIPDDLNDPIDVVIYDACDSVSPYFKNTNHTPNILTTYSLITGLIAAYFLYKRKIEWFVVFMLISYFFDCFDGFFARKYKMVSKFGDYYDHIKDVFILILIIVIVIKKYRSALSLWIILFCVVFFIFTNMFHGCVQKYSERKIPDKKGETLDATQTLCKDTNDLKWVRFFGPGMACVGFIGIIVYFWYKTKTDSKSKV
jgi:phosphatidylglycerophosphate synthase